MADEKVFEAPTNWDQFEAKCELLEEDGFVCGKK